MENFVLQNNTQVGSFITLIDSDGLLRNEQVKPSFLVHSDLKPVTTQNNSKKVSLTIKSIAESDLDTDAEVILLWVHVPIPAQCVTKKSDKLFFNQHFSGLDIIEKISFHINGTEKCFKEHSRSTYRLELQHILGSEFRAFHDKYLDLTKRLWYQQNVANNDYSQIEQDVLHFPIFFRPHLKPFLVDEPSPKTPSFKIEIVFNGISKLYSKSGKFCFNPMKISEVTATLVTKFHNNLEAITECNQGIIQTETTFQNISATISTTDADDANLKHFGVELKHWQENFPVNNMFFAIDDQSFCEQNFFYGRSVNESIKCYINSCFKLSADNMNCMNLSFKNEVNVINKKWSARKIDSNRILLTFKENENLQYTTLLISKQIAFENLHKIFIDLEVSNTIKLYWFKQIELDFNSFDSQTHILTDDFFDGGVKILNGQFKYTFDSNEIKSIKESNKSIKASNLSDESINSKSSELSENIISEEIVSDEKIARQTEIAFIGAKDYSFNYNIQVIWKNIGNAKFQTLTCLTQKHFDVYFSLPVDSSEASPFTRLDFIMLDYCDYNWMDLDRKFEWKVEKISIKKKSDLNFLIEFNKNILETMRYNQPFDITMLAITSPGMVGYCDLKNYNFIVEYSNNEFFSIKNSKAIKMNCFISNYKFFNYQKRKYSNVCVNAIEQLSQSDQFQELFNDENERKFKR